MCKGAAPTAAQQSEWEGKLLGDRGIGLIFLRQKAKSHLAFPGSAGCTLAFQPSVSPVFHVRDRGTEHGPIHSPPLCLRCRKLSETVLMFFCPKFFKDFAKISYFLPVKWKQSVVRVNKVNARKYSGITVRNAENEMASVLAQWGASSTFKTTAKHL